MPSSKARYRNYRPKPSPWHWLNTVTGEMVVPAPHRVEVLDRYIEALRGEGLNIATVRSQRSILARFEGWMVLNNKEYEALKVNDITAYRKWLNDYLQISSSTVDVAVRGVNRFLSFTTNSTHGNDNPGGAWGAKEMLYISKGRFRSQLRKPSTWHWLHPRTGEIVEPAEHRVQIMDSFITLMKARGISPNTVKNYYSTLCRFEGWLTQQGKEYANLTGLDIATYIIWLREELKLKDSTINGTIISLKNFLRYAINDRLDGEYPKCCGGIKGRSSRFSEKARLITRKEFNTLLRQNRSPEMKVILKLLWDTGCRIGEVRTIRRKNFKIDNLGAYIEVTGKTGSRKVRLAECEPDVREWLNTMPTEKSDAYLFTSHDGSAVNMATLGARIQRLRAKAGLPDITYHSFRHSRAIRYAKQGWNEEAMRKHFGWGYGSSMPSHYVNLTDKDVDYMVLKSQGLEHRVPKAETEEEEIWQECHNCNHKNPIDARFCMMCSRPLSVKVAQETEGVVQSVFQGIDEGVTAQAMELARLLQNPELVKALDGLQPDKVVQPAPES